MCGRYASARNVDVLAAEFEAAIVERDVLPLPSWNVAPTDAVPVVVAGDGGRTLTAMRWGLVPAWADDPSIGSRMINARLETVTERPAFREAALRQRCLLPADGWYEWMKGPAGARQAYFLHRPDEELVAFAGLWAQWHPRSGPPLRTVTIVTAAAPDDLGHVHDRAPVIVPRELWADWLDPADERAIERLRPTPAASITPRPVGPAVGDVRSDGPDLVAPVEVVEQDPLL